MPHNTDHPTIPIDPRFAVQDVLDLPPAAQTLSQLPREIQDELARRTRNSPRQALHVQLPYVSMLPIPDRVRTLVATTIDVVEHVDLDVNTQLVLLSGSDTFLVAFNSSMVLPLIQQSDGGGVDVLVSPTGLWYIRGKGRLSVGMPNIGTIVSVAQWVQV